MFELVPDRHDASEVRAALAALAPELRRRALRLCRDPVLAEDVAQDALERALRFESRYAPGSNVRAWAMQILFNVFASRWRSRRRERRALESLGSDPCSWALPEASFSPEMGDGAMLRSTRRSLDALSPSFRAVVELVDLGGATYRDAARDLGITVGTVMSRLHRARRIRAPSLAEREAA